MNSTFSFDTLPEGASSQESGNYNLVIVRAEDMVASTGSKMLQLDYQIKGTESKVRFDNLPYETADGKQIAFGLSKLKKILTAVGLKPEGTFTMKMISKLIIGKEFNVNLDKDETSGYLKLKDINSITKSLPNDPKPEDFVPTNEAPGPAPDSAEGFPEAKHGTPKIDIDDDF